MIGFLGCVNLYAQRVDMGVAIVCMVNHTASQSAAILSNNNTPDSLCADSPALTGNTRVSSTLVSSWNTVALLFMTSDNPTLFISVQTQLQFTRHDHCCIVV